MEQDPGLQNEDAHQIAAGLLVVVVLSPGEEPVGQELHHEGDKDSGQQYGGGRGFVVQLAQALVPKHETRVGEQLGGSGSRQSGPQQHSL